MRRLGILLWLLLLIGCRGSLEKKAVGSWQQEFDANITTGVILRTKLELSADHTFTLKLPAPIGNNVAAETVVEGTWSGEDDTIMFTPRSFGGKLIGDIQKGLEGKAEEARQKEIARASQDLIRRQQLAAAGYTDTSAPEPVTPVAAEHMILPDKGKLLEDGRKIYLRFRDDAAQAVELVKK